MLLKYPRPEKMEVVDDSGVEDAEVVAYDPNPRVPPSTMDAQEAAARMTRLHAAGLSLRAVVVGKFVTDAYAPKNWGIITDVWPFNKFPLEVSWCFGTQKSVTDGADLVVLYRGMSKTEMAEFHKPSHMAQ